MDAEFMARTFDARNKDIKKTGMSVAKALEKYPALRDFQELRREFERVVRKRENEYQPYLDCMLKQYAENEKGFTCTNIHCKEALRILQDELIYDDVGLNAARIILYGCAQSKTRWWDNVIKTIKENGDIGIGRPQPTVLLHGPPFGEKCADVYCEKMRVTKDVTFYEAVLTCYFLYWIFNMEYPRVDEQVYQLFDSLRGLNLESHG